MNSEDNIAAPNRPVTIALAGNPNSGKTSIFNHLTGTRQHVANYPGVTVEKKEGEFTHRDRNLIAVDLPGTYGLTAYSLDELVSRNYLINEKPDVVVNVIDASNLERNLYLSVQLMELGVPMVLVLNMSDIARNRGHEIDIDLLSRLLGIRIVQTVGNKGEGIEDLRNAIVDTVCASTPHRPVDIHYGREIEKELSSIIPSIENIKDLPDKFDPRWIAVKLLENDKEIKEEIEQVAEDPSVIFSAVEKSDVTIRHHFGDSPEVVIADQRYGFISGACQEAVKSTVEIRHSMSDRIDVIMTNRVIGIPIFLGLMYLMFYLTFTIGEHPMNWLEAFFSWTSRTVAALWPAETALPLKSLIIDGIIGGVGGIIVFLPNIALLFAAIAILEDSGYMARAAFIMDRFMHKIGLHGKSFIPMVIGFGCTVPAIMATRILDNRRDRLTTMLVLPLMSCGARFPIYTLFIAAFFPQEWRARILMLLYLIGVVLAVLLIKLLRVTIFKGDSTPFVMELPPYRMPTARGILTHTWERSWLFLRKAGTVILMISVILWVLTSYPKPPSSETEHLEKSEAASVELSHSVAGRIGHALEPVMKPIGFDWRTSTALIGAFAAKEVFVSQLGIVFAIGEADEESESLREVLRREYSPLQAFCVMLFCLISIPCMATIATTWKESGSWKWGILQMTSLTLLAYVITFAVFQIGQLFLDDKSAEAVVPVNSEDVRVVSLAPSLTEIVCAIGAESTLVGRTTACDYPPDITRKVRVIGGFGTPSLELLVAASPTLVFTAAMADHAMADKIQEIGIRLEKVKCNTIDDIPDAIEKIGVLVNRDKQAGTLASQLREKTGELREQASRIKKRPSVYVEIWNDPIMTVGKDSFISELVLLAGGKNIGDEIKKEYFKTSPEWVISKNPDIILCIYMSRKGSARKAMLNRSGWESIRAIRTGNVHDGFNNNLLLRPGPRALEGIEAFKKCIQSNK